jgi:Ca-activated chloride channel family protein
MIELVWPYIWLLTPLPWLVRRLLPLLQRPVAALTVPSLNPFRVNRNGAAATPTRRAGRILILLWLAWFALLAAASRPQWIGAPMELAVSGRDLMLAVDLSGSMGAEDMQIGNQMVNRLVAMQAVLGDFIERRRGDRVGLILFGTNAYLQTPLTFDLDTVQRLLIEAPIGIAGGRTAIGDAIGLAVKHLRLRPAEERVLILLTDGANNSGEVAPEQAAELAAASGIRIYTVGLGADTMRLPGLFGALTGGMVNPSAEMDEASLTAIAELTGGRYFRATNPQELAEIYVLLDALEPVDQDPELFRPTVALYHWPLALAWTLLGGLIALQAGGRRHA